MPFDIEKSLFSRHFKKLTAETQTEKNHQHEEQNLEKLKQYCKYLEQSNQQLINAAQAQHQTDRSHFKQQQQLHKQLTEKQETLSILQNQLEIKQIEAEKQHKTILKLEMRIEYLEHAKQQNSLKAENKRLQTLSNQVIKKIENTPYFLRLIAIAERVSTSEPSKFAPRPFEKRF